MQNKDSEERRLRILVLSFSPIIRDPRVLRQIELFKHFADVVSCGYGEAPDGVVEHIRVPDEYKGWRSSFKRTGLLLGARFHDRLYFDSDRIKFVRNRIPVDSVDIIFANDVLAAPVALALRPSMGVHADLHEYAPKQGEDKLQWRILIAPLMRWACRKYVTKVDSVSTVATGIAEEYARAYKIATPSVVPNATAYDSRFSPTPTQQPLRLIHAGAAGRGRRIEVMIDAVARTNELRAGAVTLDLRLIAGDQAYIEELKVKAEHAGAGAVKLLPPVSFTEIIPMLHQYDVGFYLCPPVNFNMLHALPNKLFEFVQARLAVVIGPSPEMKAVVDKYNFGVVTSGFDAESAARTLVNPSQAQVDDMKAKSHAAARELSAEEVVGPWEDAVRKLAATV